jgi:hypothetical protein
MLPHSCLHDGVGTIFENIGAFRYRESQASSHNSVVPGAVRMELPLGATIADRTSTKAQL